MHQTIAEALQSGTLQEECPYCLQAIDLSTALNNQECPHCGQEINSCSICRSHSCAENCPLDGVLEGF